MNIKRNKLQKERIKKCVWRNVTSVSIWNSKRNESFLERLSYLRSVLLCYVMCNAIWGLLGTKMSLSRRIRIRSASRHAASKESIRISRALIYYFNYVIYWSLAEFFWNQEVMLQVQYSDVYCSCISYVSILRLARCSNLYCNRRCRASIKTANKLLSIVDWFVIECRTFQRT